MSTYETLFQNHIAKTYGFLYIQIQSDNGMPTNLEVVRENVEANRDMVVVRVSRQRSIFREIFWHDSPYKKRPVSRLWVLCCASMCGLEGQYYIIFIEAFVRPGWKENRVETQNCTRIRMNYRVLWEGWCSQIKCKRTKSSEGPPINHCEKLASQYRPKPRLSTRGWHTTRRIGESNALQALSEHEYCMVMNVRQSTRLRDTSVSLPFASWYCYNRLAGGARGAGWNMNMVDGNLHAKTHVFQLCIATFHAVQYQLRCTTNDWTRGFHKKCVFQFAIVSVNLITTSLRSTCLRWFSYSQTAPPNP